MLKLCHVITGLGVGGTERFLIRLLEGGLTNAASNLVISLTGQHPLAADVRASGARLELLNFGQLSSLPSNMRRARAAVRHFRPDVVQGWMYHGNLAASLLQRSAAPRARAFWSVRDSLQAWPHTKTLTKGVIRLNALASSSSCQRIIYNAQQARRDHEAIGFSRERGIIIPNGFASQPFGSGDDREAVRAELGVGDDAILISHIARYHPNKGQDLFVAAAATAVQSQPHLRFVMAGNGVDLAFPPASLPPELRGSIIVKGNQADPARLMRASDIFVLSSRSEGLPNALAEAMQAGCACIAADVGDVGYLLNGTGLTVAPGDSAAIARAMVELARNKPLRQSLGTRAAARIAQDFALNKAVKSFLDLYAGN